MGKSINSDLATLVALVFVVSAGVGFTLAVQSVKPERPCPVKARALASDYELYAGELVSIPSEGFEETGPLERVYRAKTDEPPSVVCKFFVEPTKGCKRFVGTCRGISGGSVLVVNCIGRD